MTKLELVDLQLARLHDQQTRVSERLFTHYEESNDDLPDFGLSELDEVQSQMGMLIGILKDYQEQ